MAEEAQLSLQVAEQLIYEWYHDLKTDQLPNDELNFELAIRSILIRDDPTLVRRKRAVRDHLKHEKEHNTKIVPPSGHNLYDTDHEKCDHKFNEITELMNSSTVPQVLARCKTRLLHLGHRIVILLKHTHKPSQQILALQQLLLDVVRTLKMHFYSADAVSESESNPPGIEELFDDQNNTPLIPAMPKPKPQPAPAPTQVVHLSRDDIEWIRSLNTRLYGIENKMESLNLIQGLHTRLSEVENKIENLSIQQEVNTSHTNEQPAQIFANLGINSNNNTATSSQKHGSFNPQPSNLFSNSNFNNQNYNHAYNQQGHSTASSTQQQFNPNPQPSNVFSNPNSNNQNYNPAFNQKQSHQNNIPPWFNPVPDPTPNYNQQYFYGNSFNKQPDWSNSSNWQGQFPPWLAPYGTNPSMNANAFPNYFNPYFKNTRHTLPVSKWSITKYNGEDQGLTLNEFLEIVKEMALAEHVSENELFESAIHLFTGSALKWYMTMRSSSRLTSWQHLVWELRQTFMHPDLDSLIKTKIYQRRQMRNESFHEFYHEMERLFRTMGEQISDLEKVQILKQNMRIDYKKQINFQPITTIGQLTAAGQKVDALTYPAYNKVFGTEKSVNMVSSSEPKPKPVKKESNKTLPSSPKNPPQPNTSRNNYNNSPHPGSNNRNQDSSNQPYPTRPQQNAAASGPSLRAQIGPVSQLETMINNHRPPAQNQCFNCGNFGHLMQFCPLPKCVLCAVCGFRGYPTDNCPFCIKNDLTASQNRRPLI